MITPELIQQTESRFAERQAIRQQHEAKIREGAILEADTPERVRQRLRHITSAIVETEGVGLPTAGQPTGPAVPAIERILGRNDLMSVRYFELGVRVARSVGRIHVRTPKGSGFGTGFLVAPQLVLTNNHVFENASVAGDSRVEFDFQEGADGKLRSSIFLNFDPATFFVTDKALDFSLVALKGDVRNLAKLGFNGLTADEGKVIVGEYVTIIQHPSGERKQVALRENQIVDVLDNFLHYKTDTSPGSSGSPVFNDQWEIVALHHSGIPQRDSSGNILTRDGKVWNAAGDATQTAARRREGLAWRCIRERAGWCTRRSGGDRSWRHGVDAAATADDRDWSIRVRHAALGCRRAEAGGGTDAAGWRRGERPTRGGACGGRVGRLAPARERSWTDGARGSPSPRGVRSGMAHARGDELSVRPRLCRR